jgi:hypothetical protein
MLIPAAFIMPICHSEACNMVIASTGKASPVIWSPIALTV